MSWTSESDNMAMNVIAKVEGSGAWDAINPSDPITLGLMQWFGTRAAGLLTLIKNGKPAEYAKIAASLRSDHAANADTKGFWNTRDLTDGETRSLKPVLRACQDIQIDLLKDDISDYKGAATRIGMSPDNNTNAVIYFMVMYHQTPARAISIVKRTGPGSSIDRLYTASMNDTVFSRYKTYRYTPARNYIKSGVAPTIINLNDDDDGDYGDSSTGGNTTPPSDNSTEGESLFDQVRKGVKRIEVTGDQLLIHLADGNRVFAVPTQGRDYIVSAKMEGEVVAPPTITPDEEDDEPDPTPDPPTGNDVTDKQNAIVKFMTDRVGRYSYSQGASRLTPEKNRSTDCSGLVRFAYLSIMKIDVGTYTDAQLSNSRTRIITSGGGGNSPNESLMKKGDLVISRRYGTASNRRASHVEIYMGNGRIIGHGGPMAGPIVKDMAARTRDKQLWWVKRLKEFG